MSYVHDIVTPALVLDEDRLGRNLTAMRRRLDGSGVSLRPHLKTAKCVEVAERACDGGPRAITVSTLAEVRFFAAAGFFDQTYAVGFAAHKVAALAELCTEFPRLSLGIVSDSAEAVRNIGSALSARQLAMAVWLEVDCGDHRAGVPWDAPEELEGIARVIEESPALSLAGVLTHAGHSYRARSMEEAGSSAEK